MSGKKSQYVIIQELDHYRVDLRGRPADVSAAPPGITFEYCERVPPDLFSTLGFTSEHHIDEHTASLVAKFQGAPIGCKLFNLQGKARHISPFKHTHVFGAGHLYSFGLFIKPEFRGRGIGKLIGAKSIDLFSGKFEFMDIFIEPDNYVSVRNARQLGFQWVRKIILLKMPGLGVMINLNTPLKRRLYRHGVSLARLGGGLIILGIPKLTRYILSKVFWFKDELFLTAYSIRDAQAPDRIKGVYFCKHNLDTAFLNRIYPHGYRAQKEDSFLRARLRQRLSTLPPGIDFVLADTRLRYIRKTIDSFSGFTLIPKWVDRVNDAFNGFSDFSRTKNRNAYSDIQANRKHPYDFEFTKDESLCKFFYTKMYAPYICNRYQGEEILQPYAAIRNDFQKGGMFMVKDTTTGKYVSGSVVNIENGIFYPRKLGILNGDPELLKQEVLSALYISYFRFMEQNKLRRINLGGSRSFLNDGVLKYKEKWAPDIRFNPRHDHLFIFKVCTPSEAMNRFLMDNPFISIEKEGLAANIFLPEETKPEMDTLRKIYSLKGLSDVRIVRTATQDNRAVPAQDMASTTPTLAL